MDDRVHCCHSVPLLCWAAVREQDRMLAALEMWQVSRVPPLSHLYLDICRVHEHVDQLPILGAQPVGIHDLPASCALKAVLVKLGMVLEIAILQHAGHTTQLKEPEDAVSTSALVSATETAEFIHLSQHACTESLCTESLC